MKKQRKRGHTYIERKQTEISNMCGPLQLAEDEMNATLYDSVYK